MTHTTHTHTHTLTQVESFNALYLAIGKEEEAAIKVKENAWMQRARTHTLKHTLEHTLKQAGGKMVPLNNNHIFFNFLTHTYTHTLKHTLKQTHTHT